jgi:hypothetical protein
MSCVYLGVDTDICLKTSRIRTTAAAAVPSGSYARFLTEPQVLHLSMV